MIWQWKQSFPYWIKLIQWCWMNGRLICGETSWMTVAAKQKCFSIQEMFGRNTIKTDIITVLNPLQRSSSIITEPGIAAVFPLVFCHRQQNATAFPSFKIGQKKGALFNLKKKIFQRLQVLIVRLSSHQKENRCEKGTTLRSVLQVLPTLDTLMI